MDQYYVLLAEALRDRLAVIADHQLRDQDPDRSLDEAEAGFRTNRTSPESIAGRHRSDAGSLSPADEPE